MLHKQQGFSLVELSIYMIMVIIIITIINNWMVDIYTIGIKEGKETMRMHEVYSGLLALAEDIAQAPSIDQWKKCEPTYIVWSTDEKEQGWEYKNHGLYKITRSHTHTSEKTIKHRTLMARGINSLLFKDMQQKDGRFISCECIIKKGNNEKTITISMVPRNKQISVT